ncbi:MAG: hypothetical protein ABIJ09_01540 [Pseudomonadota bacterium]
MSTRHDRDIVFESLKMFDRPEEELRRRCLDADEDVDYLVEKLFSTSFDSKA